MNFSESQLTKPLIAYFTIMDELRAQCPWEQKANIANHFRHLTIEETYELGRNCAI